MIWCFKSSGNDSGISIQSSFNSIHVTLTFYDTGLTVFL
jgi:hypothetical protein